MSLIVQKYGGTSIGTPERIKNTALRILETQRKGHSVVAIVSAMAGVTDSLIKLAHEITLLPTDREIDALLATGEQTTTALTAMAINSMGGKAVSLTGWQAGIFTDSVHTKAKIHDIIPTAIHQHLQNGIIVIVAGFQGHTSSGGHITTLGRGGSDLTAIALAATLKADHCEIYTDVDGIFTADPRIVPAARQIEAISYDELLEMASSGAKVMQSRSVEFAKKFKVPFEVRNSFNNNRGTIVKEEGVENVVVSGVSIEKNQAKVTISHVPDRPGSASRLFGTLAEINIVVDVIIQNVNVDNPNSTDISFTINKDDLEKVGPALEVAAKEIGAGKITKRDGISKLSVVGIGMRTHSGVAAKLFEALSRGGINIQMISTSEIKIAVIIDESRAEEAARLVHEAFHLG